MNWTRSAKFMQIKAVFSLCSGPFFALVLLFVICACTNDVFLTTNNLMNIMRQVSYSGLIALGMTLVIVAGGIDLSVGSLFALCGVCSLLAIRNFTPFQPVLGMSTELCGLLIGAAVGILSGVLGGMLNGAAVVLGRIPPFIATLGTYSIFRSLALYMADSGTISTENYFRSPFLPANELLTRLGECRIAGISLPAVLLILTTVILGVILARTAFGRHVCAVGSNDRVARFAGIRVERVRFITYVIIGLCVGISAFLAAGRLGSVSSTNAGLFYELDAIAAVIIGGAAMSGGRGTLAGTLAGILILGILSNILDMWGVAATLQGLVKGLVIIISVLIQKKG